MEKKELNDKSEKKYYTKTNLFNTQSRNKMSRQKNEHYYTSTLAPKNEKLELHVKSEQNLPGR